jgi:hypothetical protein
LAATWCTSEDDEDPGPDFAEFLRQLHPFVFGDDPTEVVEQYLVGKYKELKDDGEFLQYAHKEYGSQDETLEGYSEHTKVMAEHTPVSKANDNTGWFGEDLSVKRCMFDYWYHENGEHAHEKRVDGKRVDGTKPEAEASSCSILAAVWSRKWRKEKKAEKKLGKWTKLNQFSCIKAWNTGPPTAGMTTTEGNLMLSGPSIGSLGSITEGTRG